jgi:hypothetical protein
MNDTPGLSALRREFLSWVIDGQPKKIIVLREVRRRAKPETKAKKTATFPAPMGFFDKMARALFTRRGATKTRSRRPLLLFTALPPQPRRIATPGFPGYCFMSKAAREILNS